jgi:hypothetical protein
LKISFLGIFVWSTYFEYGIGYAEHSNMYQYFVFVSKFDADANILICVKICVTIWVW